VPRLPHKGFRSVSSPTESSSCLPRLAVGEAVSLEDKPIGPVEVEMPDLLGSDPIGNELPSTRCTTTPFSTRTLKDPQ
jgi:hypothetical protein